MWNGTPPLEKRYGKSPPSFWWGCLFTFGGFLSLLGQSPDSRVSKPALHSQLLYPDTYTSFATPFALPSPTTLTPPFRGFLH